MYIAHYNKGLHRAPTAWRLFYTLLIQIYKPDSKKVGTLYKLWIKTECNAKISIFYSEYNIDDISNV